MESGKQYVISVIVCLLCSRILSQIISDPKRKSLLRLITGMILAVSMIRPFSEIHLDNFIEFSMPKLTPASVFIEAGKHNAEIIQAEYIKASCEAYILDKAKAMGADVQIQITLNGDLLPVSAEICMNADRREQLQLKNLLMTDFGIPEENQIWIWNQENNSS